MLGIVNRFDNLLWERRFRISTRGIVPTEHPDAVHYATMRYRAIERILDALALTPDDVFVDVGCGRGRVVCCAARRRLREVVGVEISSALARQAQDNVDSLRHRRTATKIVNISAPSFDFSVATVLFFFDPFGSETMQQVLEAVERDRAGRPLRIAYANPTQVAALAERDWIVPTATWPKTRRNEHSVAFFRSR